MGFKDRLRDEIFELENAITDIERRISNLNDMIDHQSGTIPDSVINLWETELSNLESQLDHYTMKLEVYQDQYDNCEDDD